MINIKKWLFIIFAVPLVNCFSQDFVLENDIRLKEGDFYYQHTDITFEDKVSDYFTPFLGYRFVNEDKKKWDHFHRFHAGFNTKISRLSLRQRVEYTPDWNLKNDDLRLRSRIKYSVIKFGQEHPTDLYLYNEFFISLDPVDYNRNRIGCGIETKLTKNVTSNIYYFSETKKSHNWKSVNVLALSLKYKF